MKKFVSIVSLVLVVLMLTMTLASCSKIDKDPEAYAEKLEDNDFEVALYDADETGGKIVISTTAYAYDAKDSAEWIDTLIVCQKDEAEGNIFYCYDDERAKELEEDLNKFKEDDRDFVEYIVKREGNIVFFGDEEAWKAM